MDYSIKDSSGKVVGTASSASEARAKLEKGRCIFGDQTILDETGAQVSEAELDVLCTDEAETASITG